jgi:hypothetical protein
MERIDAFSLAKHEGPYEKWPRRTRLYFNGNDTGVDIPGYIVEGQYRCSEGYLLITSHDCPFEESNDFLLLGSDFRVLAQNRLGVPYASFLIHAHWPISSQSLRLHYYERLFFTLSIEKSTGFFRSLPRLALKPFDEPESDATASSSIACLQRNLQEIRQRHAKSSKTSPRPRGLGNNLASRSVVWSVSMASEPKRIASRPVSSSARLCCGKLTRLRSIILVALAVAINGCDAVDSMRNGFKHSQAVSAELEKSLGLKSFVGFNWNNGSPPGLAIFGTLCGKPCAAA